MNEILPRTTVAAIIEKNGKILLTKRNIEPYKGRLVPPGGHIKKYEKVEDAIKREVKEETGLDIQPKFLFYHDEILPELSPRLDEHSVVLVFHAKAKGAIKINEESSEYKWFTPEEALKLKLAYKHNEVIEKWLKLKP